MLHGKKYQGFTLLEIILVVGILSMVALAAGQILSKSFKSYATLQNLSITNAQTRIALECMSRRIRRIASTSNITGTITASTANTLSFNEYEVNSSSSTKSNTANYALSGTDLMFKSSRFAEVQYPLARGITNLTFTFLDKTGAATATKNNIRYITIRLTSTLNNTNTTLQTTVNLRNLS